jgi:hypothetical protein
VKQRQFEKTVEEARIKAQQLIFKAWTEYLGKRADREALINGETEEGNEEIRMEVR